MKIYLVGIADCESNVIRCICTTKEIAERELFRTRDKLIKEWKELDKDTQEWLKESAEEDGREYEEDDMYKVMIENLSSDDYENWDNYPHDCVYIEERILLDK